MRFTLCKLFLVVTMAALASAGMTLHTRLWAESIVSFSIVLYIAVAILAFCRGGDGRAFRATFAAVGAIYLLLTLCNLFSPIRDLLITNRALVAAGKALTIPAQIAVQPAPTPLLNTTTTGNGTLSFTTSPYVPAVAPSTVTLYNYAGVDDSDSLFGSSILSPAAPAGAFLIVGHCLWSWLLALAAGCFAAFVCRPSATTSPQ